MSYGGGWRPHIESALSLGIEQLKKSGLLRPGSRGGSWAWWRYDEKIASIQYATNICGQTGTLRLIYSARAANSDEREDFDYPIQLEALSMGFGGVRWWFRCPYTNRRVGKLYKFSGIDRFCARTAVRPLPTYATQRQSKKDRVLERRWAIRKKLDDDGCLFDQLTKPKWMRWKTFERYEQRDDALAQMEWGYLSRMLARGGLGD